MRPQSLKAPLPLGEGCGEGTVAQLTHRRRTLIRRYAPPSPEGRREKPPNCIYFPRSSTSKGSMRTSNRAAESVGCRHGCRAAARRCSTSQQRTYFPRSSTSKGSMRISNRAAERVGCRHGCRAAARRCSTSQQQTYFPRSSTSKGSMRISNRAAESVGCRHGCRAAARRCSTSQRQQTYFPRSSTSKGSMRISNQFIPQCRCGPVARPVAPTAAITWPCSTRSPTLTSIRDRCSKLELMPKP